MTKQIRVGTPGYATTQNNYNVKFLNALRWISLLIYGGSVAIFILYDQEYWMYHYHHYAIILCFISTICAIAQLGGDNTQFITMSLLQLSFSTLFTGVIVQISWMADVKPYFGYPYICLGFILMDNWVNNAIYTDMKRLIISAIFVTTYVLCNHFLFTVEMAFLYPLGWWHCLAFFGLQMSFDALIMVSSYAIKT